jgi:hypothetical protein
MVYWNVTKIHTIFSIMVFSTLFHLRIADSSFSFEDVTLSYIYVQIHIGI